MNFSSKYRLIAAYENATEGNCPICQKQAEMSYQLAQKTFSVYGLTLFPIGKAVYRICGSCNSRKQIKNINSSTPGIPNESFIIEDLITSHKKGFDWRNYWGSFILLGVICFLVYLIQTRR